jgi:hypothetical protein
MELGQRLQSWLFEADFFTDMVSWATPRARAAVDLSTSENSLAMTALHQEFEAYFETKLEKFCLDAGATAEDVHLQLEAAIKEGGERSTEASSVVDFIVALADFDLFTQMMRDVARQAVEEEKAAQVEKKESTDLSSETAVASSSSSSSSSSPSWSGSSSS